MFPEREKEKWNNAKNDVFGNVANSLIENYIKNSNLVALKIIFYISKKSVKSSVTENHLHIFEIDTNEITSFCNISKKSLQRNIKKMTETSITISDQEKQRIDYISLIPRASFIWGVNKIEIGMFHDIYIMCKEVVNRYTNINLENMMKLESKHSIRMVAILERISQYSQNVGKRATYSKEILNGIFGTNYKRISQIEQKILKPVKEELDKHSKFSFIMQVNYDKSPSSKGRPKAVSVTIDLVDNRPKNRKEDENRDFLKWVKKIRDEYINEKLLFYPSENTYLRVDKQGHLYFDNGTKLSVNKAKEFWKWMYENMERLEIYKK
jgi:AraC-like DNA-binding protein